MRTTLAVALVLLLLAYWRCTEYDDGETYSAAAYSAARDVMIMLVVGFGFLMTFLKKYGFGAVGFTLCVSALVIVWNILVQGFWHQVRTPGLEKIRVGIPTLLKGEFAAATVLISFGAVLGKVSMKQLAVMGLFEVVFYGMNDELIVNSWLAAEDVGGTICIHAFGAYFGLAVAYVLGVPREDPAAEAEGSTVVSDLLAMLGSVVLFVYWPSFVYGEVTGTPGQSTRCIVNTYLALCASVIATFIGSGALKTPDNPEGKLRAVDVQNAALAGGVAIGSSARLTAVHPAGALLIGTLAGALSVVGYASVQPMLLAKCGLHDTCGVHNLHGMPGIFGALASAVAVAVANRSSVYSHTEDAALLRGAVQLAALFSTLAVAITSGLAVGKILQRIDGKKLHPFDDAEEWEVPNLDHHGFKPLPNGDAAGEEKALV